MFYFQKNKNAHPFLQINLIIYLLILFFFFFFFTDGIFILILKFGEQYNEIPPDIYFYTVPFHPNGKILNFFISCKNDMSETLTTSTLIWLYNDVSKVLPYSNNMRYNLAAPEVFVKVVKMMSHTTLWDAEFTWYSLSATHQIHFYCLEHSLKIDIFGPILLCQIDKILAACTKFLQPSDYCTVINCAFTFCLTNIFGYFRNVTGQFKFIKYKLVN